MTKIHAANVILGFMFYSGLVDCRSQLAYSEALLGSGLQQTSIVHLVIGWDLK